MIVFAPIRAIRGQKIAQPQYRSAQGLLYELCQYIQEKGRF
jgi:hypothetical protein